MRQQYIDKMKQFEDKHAQDIIINKERKTLKVTTAPGQRATASGSHILCCNGCDLGHQHYLARHFLLKEIQSCCVDGAIKYSHAHVVKSIHPHSPCAEAGKQPGQAHW